MAIRADASAEVGTGHVMRCLTLANALAARGASVFFVSRDLPGHLRDLVAASGHRLLALPPADGRVEEGGPRHASWLGTSQHVDIAETLALLDAGAWDWMLVDHYAIDARWETGARQRAAHIAVIDDLADRPHNTDVLLDQNLHRGMEVRYSSLVPAESRLLLGPEFALLRPEFAERRARTSVRSSGVRRVLVAFGGSDRDNQTSRAIAALASIDGLAVDVVVGALHPGRDAVESACARLGFECHVQSHAVADLMAAADLSIGSSGSMSWERCCVWLPAICVASAFNQVSIAEGLADAGAAISASPAIDASGVDELAGVLRCLASDGATLQAMSERAGALADGGGAARVASRMTS